MNFISVLLKMVELFLVIVIGYAANKGKIFDQEARMKVSSLVLNVTLPATILSAVMTQDNLPDASHILQLLLIGGLSYVILLAGAFLFTFLLHPEKKQRGIFHFMFVFGNVGFVGYPVTQAVFGSEAVFYTSVFNLPFNLLVYSIGVIFIKKSAEAVLALEETEPGQAEVRQPKEKLVTWKTFTTPCMLASYVSLIMGLMHVQGPAIFGETLSMVGNITTPAALMIIGSSLGDMKIREMFGNVRVYVFAILRLIVVPILTYVIFKPFITDELLLGISAIIAGMPVATNGTLLCLQYKGDEHLMAEGTFMTTILSIITIPVLAMVIQGM